MSGGGASDRPLVSACLELSFRKTTGYRAAFEALPRPGKAHLSDDQAKWRHGVRKSSLLPNRSFCRQADGQGKLS